MRCQAAPGTVNSRARVWPDETAVWICRRAVDHLTPNGVAVDFALKRIVTDQSRNYRLPAEVFSVSSTTHAV